MRLGRGDRVVDGVTASTRRDRDAVLREQLLALVLEQIHYSRSLAPLRSVAPASRRLPLGSGLGASRASSACSSQSVMSESGAPGVNSAATPPSRSAAIVVVGDDPAAEHEHVAHALLAEQRDDPREQGVVRAREHREPDGVGVLLQRGLRDLLGRLVQAGVDDLEAGVAQRPGDDLGPRSWPSRPGLAITTR